MPGLLYSQRADFEHAQYPDHTGKKVVDPDVEGAGKCFLGRRLGFTVVFSTRTATGYVRTCEHAPLYQGHTDYR